LSWRHYRITRLAKLHWYKYGYMAICLRSRFFGERTRASDAGYNTTPHTKVGFRFQGSGNQPARSRLCKISNCGVEELPNAKMMKAVRLSEQALQEFPAISVFHSPFAPRPFNSVWEGRYFQSCTAAEHQNRPSGGLS
jgi:hypothetical protein